MRVQLMTIWWLALILGVASASALEVGLGEVDITPEVGGEKRVWLAGYGHGRAAVGVHDPLMARCVILKDGARKVAFVSVDLVGLQFPDVQRVRKELPGYEYVLVSSTHNHEGPDVIGLWGKTPLHYGVDVAYLDAVVAKVAKLVKETEGKLIDGVEVAYGTAEDATLLKDSREPQALDAVMRLLVFTKGGEKVGLLVQWNSHPESLGSKNEMVTADFPWATVATLKKKYGCPVAYFTGAVGGLMAPPAGPSTFEYAEQHGVAVAALAAKAVDAAEPVSLTPFKVSARPVFLPVKNKMYRTAQALGVLKRPGTVWTGDPRKGGELLSKKTAAQTMAVETEVGCVRLGDVMVAGIPGELYPELVYGKFQEPADPNADFPESELEPVLAEIVPTEKWLLFGLANDEIGYIIPKRQWDSRKPYAYGREKSQYGEINSCGPEAAPILMKALERCVEGLEKEE